MLSNFVKAAIVIVVLVVAVLLLSGDTLRTTSQQQQQQSTLGDSGKSNCPRTPPARVQQPPSWSDTVSAFILGTQRHSDYHEQRQQHTQESNAAPCLGADEPRLTIHGIVSDLLANHLGPLSGAFEVDMFTKLAEEQAKSFQGSSAEKTRDTSAASSVLPCQREAKMAWSIGLRQQVASSPPSCLASFPAALSTIKTYISLGVSRIAHDAELEEAHSALQETVAAARAAGEGQVLKAAQVALAAMRFSVARLISAQVHHAISAVRTVAEGFRPPMVTESGAATSLAAMFREASVSISGRSVPVRSSRCRKSRCPATSVNGIAPAGLSNWLQKRISISVDTVLSPLDPKRVLNYERQPPKEGKFWNLLRTGIGCASLERSGENPEGDRFVCNREYLLRSGSTQGRSNNTEQHHQQHLTTIAGCPSGAVQNDTIAILEAVFGGKSSSAAAAAGGGGGDTACVRLVSFGSNNEFDWEDAMVDAVKQSGAPLAGVATFDCTLKNGVHPSSTMKSIGDRFTFFPYCIGVADPKLDALLSKKRGALADAPSAPASVSLVELNGLLDGISRKSSGGGSSDGATAQRVSILKMDIESFEFVAVPRWLQTELAFSGMQLQRTSPRSNNDEHDGEGSSNSNGGGRNHRQQIRFSRLPMVQVDQLQTEIHRRGHKGRAAADFSGATWLMYLLLNYHALGFVPVVAEKNHVDNCCFEAVLARSAFYVASETWAAASVV